MDTDGLGSEQNNKQSDLVSSLVWDLTLDWSLF